MSSNKIIYTGKREGSQTYRSYILMGKLYAAMLKEYFGIFFTFGFVSCVWRWWEYFIVPQPNGKQFSVSFVGGPIATAMVNN